MIKKLLSEAEVMRRIKLSLSLFCKEVVYIDRLNAGAIHEGNMHLTLCKRGTPDLYAIIDHDGGHFLFIEVKRQEGGKQTPEQKNFEEMIKKFKHIHYIVARSVGEVVMYIQKEILDNSSLLL